MEAEADETVVFGTSTSDIQDGVTISNGAISGELKYLASGAIPAKWGAGNFIVLKFEDVPSGATSVKVGMSPSQSSGLVELLGDPDMNGVFKVTNKNTQVFKVVTTDGTNTYTQVFDLSGLTLDGSGV